MKELYVFCEGPTEQGFCTRVLQPYLFPDHDGFVRAPLITHSRKKGKEHKGGVATHYQPLRDGILRLLSGQGHREGQVFTSMIDLYGLPSDFPGKETKTRNPDNPWPYAEHLEAAFGEDIAEPRFVPYLQLHEFETLVFADTSALEFLFDDVGAAIKGLNKVVTKYGDVEKINDSPNTAPSKRIIQLIPRYEKLKTTAGPDIAEYIGVDGLREKCPHFDRWIKLLKLRIE